MYAWEDDGDVKAHVAQVAEHFLGKEEVTGASPVVGSMDKMIDRK
jgi:hypothetical protein